MKISNKGLFSVFTTISLGVLGLFKGSNAEARSGHVECSPNYGSTWVSGSGPCSRSGTCTAYFSGLDQSGDSVFQVVCFDNNGSTYASSQFRVYDPNYTGIYGSTYECFCNVASP